MAKIAVLVSGGGSNLQSIIDNIKSKKLECDLEFVISDRECFAVERAKSSGIKTIILDKAVYKKNLSDKINEVLRDKVDFIVLAGYLSILNPDFVKKWEKRIINIHPSLLPKYGGAGMYGIKIHEAVIKNGEKESGCTVHYVDSGIDTGEIIIQDKVDVKAGDDAKMLQERVLAREHMVLVSAIQMLIRGCNKASL